jgi:hypothetical protein
VPCRSDKFLWAVGGGVANCDFRRLETPPLELGVKYHLYGAISTSGQRAAVSDPAVTADLSQLRRDLTRWPDVLLAMITDRPVLPSISPESPSIFPLLCGRVWFLYEAVQPFASEMLDALRFVVSAGKNRGNFSADVPQLFQRFLAAHHGHGQIQKDQ